MQSHDVQPHNPLKKKKSRIARGGKRGTTAGRGSKGQKSRAGHVIRPADRDLFQRLPKLRGFKNRVTGDVSKVVKLRDLHRLGKERTVNVKTLSEAGIVRHRKRGRISITVLDGGEIDQPYIFEGVRVSASARKKIEAAGGSIKD